MEKMGVYEYQTQEKGQTQETISQKSLSAQHIFSKHPFSTKRPPKAISLFSILNIAEDKTEHAALSE